MSEERQKIAQIIEDLLGAEFTNSDLISGVVLAKKREVAELEEKGYVFDITTDEEKESFLSAEQEKMIKLIDVRNKHYGINRENDVFAEKKKEFEDLYSTLKERPLTKDELARITEISKEMILDETIHSTLDLSIYMIPSNRGKIKEAGKRDHIGHVSFVNPFVNALENFSADNIDHVLDSLVSNFDRNISDDFSETEVKDLITKFDDLQRVYDILDLQCEDYFTKGDFDHVDSFINRYNILRARSEILMDTIYKCEKIQLRNYTDLSIKYKLRADENGNFYYKVGDDEFVISRGNFMDGMALFAKAVNAFEKDKVEENISPIENESELTEEIAIDDTTTMETPQEEAIEEKTADQEANLEETAGVDTIPLAVNDEFVVPGFESETQEKAEEINELRSTLADRIPEVYPSETVDAQEKVQEDQVLSEPAELSDAALAYVEFMNCFDVDKKEATRVAIEQPEVVEKFESSNVGFGKYLQAKNNGEIAEDVSYGKFITTTLEKDQGLKYDQDEKVEENANEKVSFEPIEPEVIETEPTIEPEEQGIPEIIDIQPVASVSDLTPTEPIVTKDDSGLDVSKYEEEPYTFSNEEFTNLSERPRSR